MLRSRSLSSKVLVQPWRTFPARRCASSAVTANEERPAAEDRGRKKQRRKENKDIKYEDWLESIGKKFKEPLRRRNWLGGQPFPLNPTFKPPAPISNQLRNAIWNQYMADPDANNVRALSERYGISIKRVDAILRLKGLEQHWIKKKPIQTGFVKGMEELLGVTESRRIRHDLNSGRDELGEDAVEADKQSDLLDADGARDRYHRLFWEPVAEGQAPILPRLLDEATAASEKYMQAKEDAKSERSLLTYHADTPVEKVVVTVMERRPTFKFVDVGGKFLDTGDRVRRMKEAERRAKIRSHHGKVKVHTIEPSSNGSAEGEVVV